MTRVTCRPWVPLPGQVRRGDAPLEPFLGTATTPWANMRMAAIARLVPKRKSHAE